MQKYLFGNGIVPERDFHILSEQIRNFYYGGYMKYIINCSYDVFGVEVERCQTAY